jgi:hypothetical protein
MMRMTPAAASLLGIAEHVGPARGLAVTEAAELDQGDERHAAG